MRRFLTLPFLIIIASCGKKDDTGTSLETDNACTSSFVMTQADGTDVPFGDCALYGADIQFAVAPDPILPQPHKMSFIFRPSTNTEVECWILWELDGMCAERNTHSFGLLEESKLTWNTTGCDMPESAKGSFRATDGGSVFTSRMINPEEGLEEGDPMTVSIEATIEGSDSSGVRVTGTVAINQTLALQTIPYGGCQGANGDSDRDGFDGVEFGGDDCDDSDAQIHPDAIEECDGIDNNCDGEIDEGRTRTFYTDGDGDGFGNTDLALDACELPEGYAETAGDCDDADPAINPGATEICDGIDQDCDSVPDDGIQILLYTDSDGDGYGDDETERLGCGDEEGPGVATEDGDCDDDNTEIHPGATEVCDEVDNNCDDQVDEGCSD
jgi:hypothetical protein